MKTADLRLMRFCLAAIWLLTGLVVLTVYPREESLKLLAAAGLHGNIAHAAFYLAAALDIVLGLLTLFGGGRLLWLLQAGVVMTYTAIISIGLPEFWSHPFGPVLKNLPILLLLWFLYKNESAKQ